MFLHGLHVKTCEAVPLSIHVLHKFVCGRGWSGGAMVLGKLPVPGRPTNLEREGQGPSVLAVGAGGVVWTFFLLVYHFSFLLPLSGRRPDID